MKKLRTTFEKHLEKKASMATLAMVPKRKFQEWILLVVCKNQILNRKQLHHKTFAVPEVSAVGGISPYVRREQRRQAKNRKARFEEHIRMLEKQAYRRI